MEKIQNGGIVIHPPLVAMIIIYAMIRTMVLLKCADFTWQMFFYKSSDLATIEINYSVTLNDIPLSR